MLWKPFSKIKNGKLQKNGQVKNREEAIECGLRRLMLAKILRSECTSIFRV
jgi:hypothetical protein